MLKAVFVDYTGTIIQEDGPDIQQLIMRAYQNSNIESPKAMVAYWWNKVKRYEEESFGERFITEDEIVDQILEDCREEIHLEDDKNQLHELCRRFWVHAPAFDDTAEFFARCPLPVYIISNNGVKYIEVSMAEKGLNPAGIISGDMARAYKPHKELFEKALEIAGVTAKEVIHIGDSAASDVKGALAAGITPILLDRTGKEEAGEARIIHSLPEILDYIDE